MRKNRQQTDPTGRKAPPLAVTPPCACLPQCLVHRACRRWGSGRNGSAAALHLDATASAGAAAAACRQRRWQALQAPLLPLLVLLLLLPPLLAWHRCCQACRRQPSSSQAKFRCKVGGRFDRTADASLHSNAETHRLRLRRNCCCCCGGAVALAASGTPISAASSAAASLAAGCAASSDTSTAPGGALLGPGSGEGPRLLEALKPFAGSGRKKDFMDCIVNRLRLGAGNDVAWLWKGQWAICHISTRIQAAF